MSGLRAAKGLMISIWLSALSANALPPERIIEMVPGSDRFEKGYAGIWQAISEDPGVVEVQAFDTEEVFFEAKKAGKSTVVLYNPTAGQVKFWLVRVRHQKAQGESGLDSNPQMPSICRKDVSGSFLCQIGHAQDVQTLHVALMDSNLILQDVHFQYKPEAMQGLLRRLKEALQHNKIFGLSLSFVGASLKVEGPLPDREVWVKMGLVLFGSMVGPLLLDDHTRVLRGAKTDQVETQIPE